MEHCEIFVLVVQRIGFVENLISFFLKSTSEYSSRAFPGLGELTPSTSAPESLATATRLVP